PPGGRRALPWIAAVVGVLLAAGVIGFLATRGGRGPQTVATTPVGATSSATSGATSGTSAPTSGPTSGATSAPTSGASTGPTTGPTTATTTAPTTGPTSGPSRTTGTSGPGPDPQVVAARAVARQFVADVNAHPQSSPAACQDLVRIARYSPATPQALCHGFSDVVHTTLHIHDAVPTGTGLVVVGYETVACQQTSGGLQTSTFEGAWTVDPVQGVIVESHRSPVSVVPGCG
ncbi:MAG TPA: hypothetical protein VNN79_05150, partial [Actinomycetota bacterium]|nr:hypothetical protein [Actinomycetota bacterium]